VRCGSRIERIHMDSQGCTCIGPARIFWYCSSGNGANNEGYWLPNPLFAPQSGQSQVIPLQDIPQKFSIMHSWQIAKPQRHVQQKGAFFLQQ
jgi:hypothetical protein